jgi:hypothetical protein
MHLLFILALICIAAPRVAYCISLAPLSTSGRWIVDSNGENVTFAGVNWPGAAEAMLPEGLQYQSIEYIMTKIKSMGMNVIRLTFAIEMIDDIVESGQDVPIHTSLINALGEGNGTVIYQSIVQHNPQFGVNTTRLQVRLHITYPVTKPNPTW